MCTAKQEITQLIQDYISRQSDFDGLGLLEFWHPAGRMCIVGNAGTFRVVAVEDQAAHIQAVKARNPDLSVEFVLDEIEQITIHEDLIASVHVRYRMVFSGGYGVHRCFYNLANMDGKWGIVNAVDRGLEVTPED